MNEIKAPAKNGHEFNLLNRLTHFNLHARIFSFKRDFESDGRLSPRTAHSKLKAFNKKISGVVIFDIDTVGKDPEWWIAKLEACGFRYLEEQTNEFTHGTNWDHVFVCEVTG